VILDGVVIDEGLLRQARDSGTRMADAQHQAEVAKADYHHAVRRLHFAGASMREIADALELSHQRVHQIIEAGGGTGGWRAKKARTMDLICTFCGLPDDEVAKLIAGPGVFICDACVALVHHVVGSGTAVETERTRLARVSRVSDAQCSFCGKPVQKTTTMVAGPGVRICDVCLDLCDEVLAAAKP
jgi:hypothetical protein